MSLFSHASKLKSGQQLSQCHTPAGMFAEPALGPTGGWAAQALFISVTPVPGMWKCWNWIFGAIISLYVSALRGVLEEKQVCFSYRKIIFETDRSVLYRYNPECLQGCTGRPLSPSSRSHGPDSATFQPKAPGSACLVFEKPAVRSRQASPENGAWLDGFSCSRKTGKRWEEHGQYI